MNLHPKMASGIFVFLFCFIVIMLSKLFRVNLFDNIITIIIASLGAIVVFTIVEKRRKDDE